MPLDYPCPICGNKKTIKADFNQQYCRPCDFYWHFWMNKLWTYFQIEQHLKKNPQLRVNVLRGKLEKLELRIKRLKNKNADLKRRLEYLEKRFQS